MRGSGPTLWGDGFAEDGWADILRRDRWDDCTPDEYIFLFPKLLAPGATGPAPVPPPLRDRLRSCVATRAWRRRVRKGIAGDGLRSIDEGVVQTIGRRDASSWFDDRTEGLRALFGIGRDRGGSAGGADDDRVLHELDRLLAACQSGLLPPYDTRSAAAFSFHTGIHAGYLWPEAVLSAQTMMVAGWLGHVCRGRPALLPTPVAEYLWDATTGPGREPVRFRDADLAVLVPAPAQVETVRRAAGRRLEGKEQIVRLRPAPPTDATHERPPAPVLERAVR